MICGLSEFRAFKSAYLDIWRNFIDIIDHDVTFAGLGQAYDTEVKHVPHGNMRANPRKDKAKTGALKIHVFHHGPWRRPGAMLRGYTDA